MSYLSPLPAGTNLPVLVLILFWYLNFYAINLSHYIKQIKIK